MREKALGDWHALTREEKRKAGGTFSDYLCNIVDKATAEGKKAFFASNAYVKKRDEMLNEIRTQRSKDETKAIQDLIKSTDLSFREGLLTFDEEENSNIVPKEDGVKRAKTEEKAPPPGPRRGRRRL